MNHTLTPPQVEFHDKFQHQISKAYGEVESLSLNPEGVKIVTPGYAGSMFGRIHHLEPATPTATANVGHGLLRACRQGAVEQGAQLQRFLSLMICAKKENRMAVLASERPKAAILKFMGFEISMGISGALRALQQRPWVRTRRRT